MLLEKDVSASSVCTATESTPDELVTFWRSFSSDTTIGGRYMDTMPTTLDRFLAPGAVGQLRVWTFWLNGDMAGVTWLHDINKWGGINSAWKGVYLFPEFRGEPASWVKLGTQVAVEIGLTHLFAGVRNSNEPAKRWAAKGGSTCAGVVEKFGWFEGELDDMSIWAINAEDTEEAMRQAHLRAEFYRANPPKQALTALT